MTSIGLSMIVKDEAHVIRRCLDSVRPLIDYALVADTGSSDGTQALIRDWLATEGLPGEVIDEPWRDFAYNRSFALARLRERTEVDYALVMDADDSLALADRFDPASFKQSLDKDFYHVELRLGPTRYWRPQLLSNRREFAYKGVLHEFIAAPAGASAGGAVPNLHIEATTDGARSRNPHKYRDDALALEQALESETDAFIRARYTFYLAQSWMNAGEKEKALQLYLRRAELGGFAQEVCLSLNAAAELKAELGYPDSDVVGTFLQAYEIAPMRAEPLYGAMHYCRMNGKHHQSYLIGKQAITITEPIGALFLVQPIYDYALLEEFAAAAYRTGRHQESLEVLERLLAGGKLPESQRPAVADNARKAAERLAASASVAASARPLPVAQTFDEAMTLHRQGKLDEAERRYRTLLDRDPAHVGALHNLGAACIQQGKHDDAVELLRETLRLQPDHIDAHNNLGAALRELGRFQEAEACFREALRLNPDHPEAHNNLGVALKDLGRLEEAEPFIREALRLKPDYPAGHNSLGAVHRDLGRAAEAETCLREAVRLDPNGSDARNNLGAALQDLGRLQEAEGCFREALSLKPDDPGWHANLGMLLLLAGKFEEGWVEYEWRRSANKRGERFTQPQWTGEDTGDRVLLVHAEQGFGDTIQFCRYVPLVAAKARVILEVPRPLLRLLSTLRGADQIVAQGDPLPSFDLHCPLLSLPRAFGTRLETIPGGVPYLAADAAGVAAWRQRLADLPGLRVGLVWAGSSRVDQPGANAIDRRRSITLDHFAALADVPGVSFVSLQKGEPATQTSSPPPGLVIHDWTAELGDFADTAALVEALDLVITVDTSVVHLTGAVAKPVWLLNRFDTCWRWLPDRDDSPWYPTLRQFRQPAPGDWASVLTNVRAALASLATQPRESDAVAANDPAQSHFNYGVRLLGQEKPAEAAAAFERATILRANDPTAHCDLGVALLQQDKLDSAIAAFQAALALDPGFAQAHSNLGVALQKRGDTDRAIAHWEKAIALQPYYPDAHFNLGSALRRQGRIEQAIEHYARAVTLKPDYIQASRQLDLALREQERRLDEAAVRREQTPDFKPKLATANFNLACTLRRLGRLDEAIARYEQALDLSPTLAEAHLDLGVALQQQGSHEEAIACYRQAITVNPDFAEAHFNMGVGFARLFRPREAAACYERALTLKPDFPGARANLRVSRASAMVYAGNLSGAIGCLEEGLRQGLSAIRSTAPEEPPASPGYSLYPEALRAIVTRLAAQRFEAFLIGGALLGAMREGDFLAFDRDLDFGVSSEVSPADLDRALAEDREFERFPRPDQGQKPVLASYRFRRKIGIDFFRFFSQGDTTWCGLAHGPYMVKWLHRPFGLIDFVWQGVRLKIPDNAERFLTEDYGDWRTPNPHFGLFASPNIEGGYSPLLRVIAYDAIFAALSRHRHERTVSLCDQVLALDPSDALIRELRDRLAALPNG